MSHRRLGMALALPVTLVLLLLGSRLLAHADSAAAREVAAAALRPFQQDPPTGETAAADEQAPNISLIQNPSATCYRPVAGTGACYITWSYLQVQAGASAYVISMTVSIDGQMRAYHSGFFQNAMIVPGDFFGQGFKVTCGFPGSGGRPHLGAAYRYAIRARDTSGLKAANYGVVACPADTVRAFMPAIQRH